MHIKPTAQACAAAGCDRFVRRVLYGVLVVDVCAECALRINSLKSCPLADPYPDPKPPKRYKPQSEMKMKQEIKKAEIINAARKEDYSSKIKRLKKRYKM